ncbi:hypothetical protein MKW98_006866 [Papaver atlanticum]|uniref:Uncharacterized protein n=1 Tax=Papaver atlanticum TaxID=357466 RepID=A0AAD4ST06_9MAGN|nr:hypothetical protein MKW98_006866 [Papaver atlanticum]
MSCCRTCKCVEASSLLIFSTFVYTAEVLYRFLPSQVNGFLASSCSIVETGGHISDWFYYQENMLAFMTAEELRWAMKTMPPLVKALELEGDTFEISSTTTATKSINNLILLVENLRRR